MSPVLLKRWGQWSELHRGAAWDQEGFISEQGVQMVQKRMTAFFAPGYFHPLVDGAVVVTRLLKGIELPGGRIGPDDFRDQCKPHVADTHDEKGPGPLQRRRPPLIAGILKTRLAHRGDVTIDVPCDPACPLHLLHQFVGPDRSANRSRGFSPTEKDEAELVTAGIPGSPPVKPPTMDLLSMTLQNGRNDLMSQKHVHVPGRVFGFRRPIDLEPYMPPPLVGSRFFPEGRLGPLRARRTPSRATRERQQDERRQGAEPPYGIRMRHGRLLGWR